MLGNFNENFSLIRIDQRGLSEEYFSFVQKNLLNASPAPSNFSIVSKDEYDDYAIHWLLEYKPAHTYVGAVRLVPGKKLLGIKYLPIESGKKAHFDNVVRHFQLEYEHLAEISHLIILPNFRPKLAILGILRAIFFSCMEENIYYVYTAIDPKLSRLLLRIHINLINITPEDTLVENNTQIFLGLIDNIIKTVQTSEPDIWEVITDQGKIGCPFMNLIYNK